MILLDQLTSDLTWSDHSCSDLTISDLLSLDLINFDNLVTCDTNYITTLHNIRYYNILIPIQ